MGRKEGGLEKMERVVYRKKRGWFIEREEVGLEKEKRVVYRMRRKWFMEEERKEKKAVKKLKLRELKCRKEQQK